VTLGPSSETNPRALDARRPAGVHTRACVGCGAHGDALEMVRLVLVEATGGRAAEVVVDARGGAFGRGAHVHPTRACLAAAAKKGLPRVFKREVRADEGSLARAISDAYARRLAGLLSGGARGGHVVIGTDAVTEAAESGRMALVIVAADARAAARRAVVQHATAAGKALVYGDKVLLAKALGRSRARAEGSSADAGVRDGVAVCAVTEQALAEAVRRAWLCAAGLATAAAPADSQHVSEQSTDAAAEVHRDDAEGE
jgi:predicted RNA-binding protein YlxR (DUF448 family)/ribosomal protein L30E